MNRMPAWVCLIALTLLSACWEQRPGPGPMTAEQTIDTYLQPYLAGKNFSGVILVATGDSVLFSKAYGMAEYDRGIRNTLDSKFQIGSISKSFTATAILILRDRKLLSLDDTVSRFLPDFPHGKSITVHQLLSHTSGLPRFVFFPDYAVRSKYPNDLEDLLRWIGEKPLAFPPGTRYGYSNANYLLLASILETITGQAYDAVLDTEILRPLGLSHTGHRGTMDAIVDGLAMGWTPTGRTDLAQSDYLDYSILTGSGSLYTTAGDLLSWYNASSKGTLLTGDSREYLFGRPEIPDGYAFHPDSIIGRPVYATSGWDGVGFSARLAHIADDDMTIIILCNLNINNVTREIQSNIARIMLGESPQALTITGSSSPVDTNLAGTYRFGNDFYVPGATMRIVAKDGSLSVDDGRPEGLGALLQIGNEEFIHRQHWFRISFQRNEGIVSRMMYDRFIAEKEPHGENH